MNKNSFLLLATSWILLLFSCRGNEYIPQIEKTPLPPETSGKIQGFYLLNEGAMGTNQATLDYLDYTKGIYHKNIYATANPSVVKELGDVGNDLQVYGSKLYAVINVSGKIEVLDTKTAKRIKSIPLQNCRYICFSGGKAYASSYNGKISPDPKAPLGKVVEIDTASLSIQREVIVGYQPEELVVGENSKLFVVNSGGYRFPNYDKTLSIIDLKTFTEEKKIDIDINLHRIKKDRFGDLYISSRGDYYNHKSNLFVVDASTGEVKKSFDIPVSNMTIVNDKLYYYANDFNYNTHTTKKSFGVIDVESETILSTDLIPTEYQKKIQNPYGIAVNPISGDIYITDARDYTSIGYIYAFDKNGNFKWEQSAGNIPAHFAFVYKD